MKTPKKWFVLWFTGLSWAGKTTNADAVADKIIKMWYKNIQRLDGDDIRKNLCADLGFSKKDRQINLSRAWYVAELLSKNGVGVIASFISPYLEDREKIRLQSNNYIEIFVDTPLSVCEQRDTKGMYEKARAGVIKEFTGISDPYELPINPEITIYTDRDVGENTDKIIQYILENNFL